MKWKIHAIPTGELAGTMNILMLNSGVRPGPAPRPFGFDTEICWYKGKKAPGVRQPVIELIRTRFLIGELQHKWGCVSRKINHNIWGSWVFRSCERL